MQENQVNKKPKIGLALSGGSGRAIAHIGVLEVLNEYGIPIDIITACSSGTIVAGSYACGTMPQLKNDWLHLDKNFVLSMIELDMSGRGVLSTKKIEQWSRKYVNGKKFEDVKPRLGFVCGDLTTGEPVIMALGDILKAAQASCSVPGLFEPVAWGNSILVDGGIFSIIPINEARDMGADIVIGVDIAATKQLISKKYLRIWNGYDFLKKTWPFRTFGSLWTLLSQAYEKTINIIFYYQSDFFQGELLSDQNFFSTLGKAMELINSRAKNKEIRAPKSDIMLLPDVKHLGKMDFGSARRIYLEGRRSALVAIPRIESAIKNFQHARKG